MVGVFKMSNINEQEFVTVNNLKRFLQNSDERFAPNKNMEGIKSDGAEGYIAGKAGLVPAPSSSSYGKFLRSDGTWANPEVPTKVSELDNDSNFLTSSDLSAHTSNENIHVSTTEKTTWNNKANKATTLSGYGITDAYTKTQVDKKVSDLVNSAPETLDTLNELASALGNDPNFATTVANKIGTKANDSDVVHKSGDETIVGSKTFSGEVQTNTIKAVGGDGANISLTPPDNGGFAIRAFNGTVNKELVGYPNGMLAWDNNKILTIVNGVTLDTAQTITGAKTFNSWTTFSNGINVKWITGNKEQKTLSLYGSMNDKYQGFGSTLELHGDDANYGMFALIAKDETNTNVKRFIGLPDGTLTWSGKNIVRSINGHVADTAGNIAYNIGNDLHTVNADTAKGSIRLFVYRGSTPLTAMDVTSGGNLSLISITISAYDESVETQYGMYSIVALSTMPGTWRNIGPSVTYGCSSLFIRVA